MYNLPHAGGSMAAQFLETTKKLVKLIGWKQKTYTKELWQAVMNKSLTDPPKPTNPVSSMQPWEIKKWENAHNTWTKSIPTVLATLCATM